MNRSVDILNELKEISPLIAGIGIQNVFTVPSGYFDTIADTVMICLKENSNLTIENGDVPAGYFDNLSSSILAKIKGSPLNELQEISPLLAGIQKNNPFTVPEDYFEQFSSEVLSRLDIEEIPVLLQNARQLQPFRVPGGYFENLAADILNKVQQKATKVVTMPRRRSLFLQYAAAAVFTGLVVLGVYKFTDTSVVNSNGNLSMTAAMEPSVGIGMAMAADDKKFDETLGNLDENDIAQYLEKNGSEADVASLTSNLDESDLPDPDDYLTDEKALDKFIEEVSLTN